MKIRKVKRIEFKIHTKQKLAEFVWDLRNSFPKENLSERNNNPCIHMNLSKNLVEKILKSNRLNYNLKKEIIKDIKISEKDKKEIKKFIKKFELFWNSKIETIFFSEVKRIFGKKYIRRKYICYPTNKIVGAYFGKNEISIIFNSKSKKSLSPQEFSSIVLAEEIVHLIYWKLWQEIYNVKINNIDEIFDIEGPKWSCWHIAELLPEYLLIENDKFKKFNWDKDNRCKGYPWIPKFKKILDPVWKESKNIKEFIIKSHKKIGIKP
jgi:hypothetical protein|tara:strand:- start:488 stop:1282 length:795 start_codon:yes stop_codon:yes gene_type:complete